MIKKPIPKFASEEEEANWWYEHRDEHDQWMLEAIQNGETTTLAAVLERQRKRLESQTVSVVIDKADLAKAQAIASKKGLSYELVLRDAVHRGLENEDQLLGSQP